MLTSITDLLAKAKPVLAVICLILFWTWESFLPLIGGRPHRWRHARRNITVSVLNAAVISSLLGAATFGVAGWTTRHQFGLLNRFDIVEPLRLFLAILVLDGWLYIWHRLNHRIPILWRLHRMHHADYEMDVSTATRFHFGELLASGLLRLGMIPLIGVSASELLMYEGLLVTVTMFHHANISVGWSDKLLRYLIVTPGMHQIHHSRFRPETDSNYSVLFSFWDRIGNTYQNRTSSEPIELGLMEFQDDYWQTEIGMMVTPFVQPQSQPGEIVPDQ